MTAVAHFPGSLDKGLLDRVRRPLAAAAALLLVADLIGLGMHLADGATSPFAGDTPTAAKARVDTPEAVVPGSVLGTQTSRVSGSDRSRAAEPLGCLSASSGCYNPPAPTSPGKTPAAPPTTPGAQPTPAVQADLAVPALGAQVSLGVGEGGCTGIALTVLAVGDCAAAPGDGAIVLNLGGTLLGD